jgi:hypothetical protein
LITENRAKAIAALRVADESERCTGSIMYRTGENDDITRLCALGVIGLGLGLFTRNDSPAGQDWYDKIRYAIDEEPLTVYRLNDQRSRDRDEYMYSWYEIADKLEELWSR